MSNEDQKLNEEFEAALKTFYQELFSAQTQLPPVFEKILYDNLWELYETA